MIMITGASSGLGAALARRYSLLGEPLLLTGRTPSRLRALFGEIDSEVAIQIADLGNASEVQALFARLNTPPKLLFHCAGSGLFGPLIEQSPQEIATLIHNNLYSTTLLLQEAIRRYQDHGVTIAVVISTAGLQPKALESSYCAVKWGIRGLLESLRLELKGKPLKLIGIYPGGMDTAFWQCTQSTQPRDHFMSADEVALMISQAMDATERGYIADLTIQRN